MKRNRAIPATLVIVLLIATVALVMLRNDAEQRTASSNDSRDTTDGQSEDHGMEAILSPVAPSDAEPSGLATADADESNINLDAPRRVQGLIQPIGPAFVNTTDSSTERSMPITLDRQELGRMRERIENGETVTVEMAFFERTGEKLDLSQVEELEIGDDEGFALKGSFQGQPGSVGVLVDWKGALAGTAMLYGRGYYRIRSVPSGFQVLDHVVKGVECCSGESQAVVGGEFSVGIPQDYTLELAGPAVETFTINVAVGYSTEISEIMFEQGGVRLYDDFPRSESPPTTHYDSIAATLEASFEFMNSIHEQSGSSARFRIAAIVPELPQESSELEFDDLAPLKKRIQEDVKEGEDRQYGGLTRAAARVGADRICMIVSSGESGVSMGLARAINKRLCSGRSTWQYDPLKERLVVLSSLQSLEIVVCHELAHTLGGLHDLQTIVDDKRDDELSYLDEQIEPWRDNSVGFGFVAEKEEKGSVVDFGYGTIMSYPHRQRVGTEEVVAKGNSRYLPVFSGGGQLKSVRRSPILLGKNGLWSDPDENARGYDNVATFLSTVPRIAISSNGGEDLRAVSIDQLAQSSKGHWAYQAVKNAIRLDVMGAEKSWRKIDETISRGEMVTIIHQALIAWNPYYIANAPIVRSSSFFSEDDYLKGCTSIFGEGVLAPSGHVDKVVAFGRRGWINTNKDLFRVDDPMPIGEFVLIAWKAFDLGEPPAGTVGAEALYEYYKEEFRNCVFPRPHGDFELPRVGAVPSGGYERDDDVLKLVDGADVPDTKGIMFGEFQTGQGASYDSGYAAPATRAMAAEVVINLILLKASNPNFQFD